MASNKKPNIDSAYTIIASMFWKHAFAEMTSDCTKLASENTISAGENHSAAVNGSVSAMVTSMNCITASGGSDAASCAFLSCSIVKPELASPMAAANITPTR